MKLLVRTQGVSIRLVLLTLFLGVAAANLVMAAIVALDALTSGGLFR